MRPQNIILLNGSHFISDMLERVISKTPGLQLVANVKDQNFFKSSILGTTTATRACPLSRYAKMGYSCVEILQDCDDYLVV